MKSPSFYIVLIISIILTSCANQSSPTGGPKDKDAPVLIQSTPKNQQLNFTGQEIELEFDELVTVNSMNKQLIITPRTDIEYEVKYKKNKVMLIFDAPLDSNTTYTFNFREGIKDLNEGNVPPDFSLAFSTGNYLDSMMISGEVSNLFSGKPIKEMSIALYHANDTMNVFDDPPLYLTKSNNNGKYLLKNLKIGSYKLVAFTDKNDNLTLQTSTEAYGFSDEVIELDTLYENFNISIFNLNVDSLKLQSARTSGQYFVLKYSKALTEYSVITLDSTSTIYTSLIGDDKEIKIYNTFEPFDSLAILSTVTDSILQVVTDTVYLKFEETKRDKDEYDYKIKTTDIDLTNPEIVVAINFNKPSIYNNPDSLFLFIDSLTQINFDSTDFTWNTTQSIVHLNKILQKELLEPKATGDTTDTGEEVMTIVKPQLYLGFGAFYSVESDTSIASTTSFKKKSSIDDTGIIKVNIVNTSTPFILQLLNKKNEVITETNSLDHSSSLIIYNNLKPGDYQLRVLLDKNNSGSWDLGNILKNIPPEPIIFYVSEEGTKEITLRANWEIGPLNFEF